MYSPVLASAPQSAPPKAGLLDRVLPFFILLFARTGLASALDHFNFIGLRALRSRERLSGTLYAAVLVLFFPAFSQLGMVGHSAV
jgi:hypothetical protein